MNIKHFIFDLDGTLWNTTEVSAAAYNHALREDGRSQFYVTSDTIKHEFGKTLSAIADDLFPEFDRTVRDELMEKCSDANIQFLESTKCPMLYPDVTNTLAQLAKRSKLYIVSNCQCGYIEMFLNKYGLNAYFTDIECYGTNQKSKAENIRLLMDRNQIRDAVYVGDTAGDYQSSVQAGIPFIFASYGYGAVPESTCTISRFSDLLQISNGSAMPSNHFSVTQL